MPISLEHRHVVTLTHLRDGLAWFSCACGEAGMGRERVVGALILTHRMQAFTEVRRGLAHNKKPPG